MWCCECFGKVNGHPMPRTIQYDSREKCTTMTVMHLFLMSYPRRPRYSEWTPNTYLRRPGRFTQSMGILMKSSRQCPFAHLNRYFLWGASHTPVISVKCRIRTVYFARICNTNYTIYFNPVNNFDWQLKQKMRSLKQKFGPEHIFVHFPGFWQLESLGRQEGLAAVQCLASKSAIMNSFPTGIGYFFLIAQNPTVTLYWTSQACFYTKSELSKELDWPNSWQIQN